jgi:choline dehydrogenase-like flavoprotein
VIDDLEQLPEGPLPPSDVCVIGAGPAGITLALDLAERGLSVTLLESGRFKADAATQALNAGEVADAQLHSPPDRYRLRQLGGASAIWGGRCMPMDALDFQARPQVPLSGWPIGLEDLLPFYERANQWAEAGRYAYDTRQALPGAAPLIAGFESTRILTDGLERFSCPTDFGRRYRRRLALSSRVRVLLGATVTRLQLAEDGRSLSSVLAESLKHRRIVVRARATVLATGGLETARLLLASQDVARAGIGNAHDVVGRYYMCHIAGNVGQLQVAGEPSGVRHGYERSAEGIYCRRRLQVAPAEQQRLGLANLVARLHFPRISDPAHQSGVLSGLFLARRFIAYEYARRLHDAPPNARDGLRHVRNVLADPLQTSAFLAHWLRSRTLAERKFPSVILRNRSNAFSLEIHAEQRPLAASRVSLSAQRDALGLPRLRVDWRYDREDIESVRRSLDLMASEFEASRCARLSYCADTLEEDLLRFGAYGGHHLGTARMGTDRRSSVVDAHCQVHGVRNLFVAGSAVFATSSQANPTLTLLALALRLSAHLQQRLQPPPALDLDRSPTAAPQVQATA